MKKRNEEILVQHLIHDNNHHYKLSFNIHRVSVGLLESKGLKKSEVYSLVIHNHLIMRRTLRSFADTGLN